MDLLCLHQTKTARPQMQNERGRGDRPAAASFPGGHIQPCLFPRLPAAGEPGRATQGQTATEGQGSEREETQTHGEVRRELTVAGSRLNSLGEQHKSSGFPPQACPRLDPLVSLLEIHHSVGFALWPTSAGRAGAGAGSTALSLLRLPAGGWHPAPQPEGLPKG